MRNKEQVFEVGVFLAEGDRVDIGIKFELDLGALEDGELDDLAPVGPGHGPQLALVVESQRADPQVFVAAPLRKLTRDGIENTDPGIGGNEQAVGARLDGEGHRHAVAKAAEHGPRFGVEQQQRATAGGRPQAALAVESEVEYRVVQRRPGHASAAAVAREAVDLAAVGAAGDIDQAVSPLGNRHRADAAVTLTDAIGKQRAHEGPQHAVELALPRRRHGARDQRTGLREDHAR